MNLDLVGRASLGGRFEFVTNDHRTVLESFEYFAIPE
jgi:hypothetical protein